MFHTLSSKRGMTMIEVCIALLLLSVGVLALISLQGSAWRLSGKSDYLGRASGILVAQLQATEAKIMNPNIAVTTGTATSTVYPGGQSTQKQGDAAFTVQTTTTALGGNTWRVTVNVTWPGNAAGIRESLNVTRQEYFRQ
jgi:type IV pilus modification protein PilV